MLRNSIIDDLLTLQDRLTSLEFALLKHGICYKCGGFVEAEGQAFQGKEGILYRCRLCKFQTVKLKREAK